MFMTVKDAAAKWGISDRRVRILCSEGKIPGAFQQGHSWKIPENAVKPTDGRYKTSSSLLELIDQKKKEFVNMKKLISSSIYLLNKRKFDNILFKLI